MNLINKRQKAASTGPADILLEIFWTRLDDLIMST